MSTLGGLTARVRARLDSARIADGTILALALLVGILTGLAAGALITLVGVVESVAFGEEVTTVDLLVVPVAGGIVVFAISRLAPEVLGSGIINVMESLVLRGGRLRARIPVLASLATSTAIGTGMSGGREAPMVLIGGSIGSGIGHRFGLDATEVRSLVAAGAAAGIGASFNAPIGGMLFAIEVIIGGLRSKALQVIVVSSVAASVIAQRIVGDDLIYQPAYSYRVRDRRELLLYLLLGLIAGGVAAVIIGGENLARRVFAPVRNRFGDLGTLMLGGLLVGAVALWVPEVLGAGENLPAIDGVREPVQRLIDGGYGFGWGAVISLSVLFVAKFVATMATVAARSAVGAFAPTLFLGAALGGLLATLAAIVLPEANLFPGAYALVGMAAVYGASGRAPLTAVLIVFELTGDYELVLPLMLSVGIATFVADRTTPGSSYTLPLLERGIVYSEPDDVDLLQTVTVEEVMTTGHPTVRPSLPLRELRRRFDTEQTHGFAVVSGGMLEGVVTIRDLARAEPLLADGMRPEHTVLVRDLMTTEVLTASPTDEVFKALRLMASIDVGRVPVVTQGGTYLGMLRRGDIVDAYRTALRRGVDRQHDTDRASLRELTGVRFLELSVAAGSAADGAAIADLDWPTSAVVTSVRRGAEVIVPKGAVVLEAGDEVVMLSSHADAEESRALFSRPDT